jgi:lipopolysaccharide export system permease protein
MKRRSFYHIYMYIGKEFIFSFLVAFLFFFFIFFVNQLLLLAEDVLSKNVPLKDVIMLIVYSLPLISSLSFPFGTLVGALMTVGRFSSDNEVLAFRASGIPHRRIFFPFILISLVFSLISFGLNDYFLPQGTINFGKLYRKLLYSNPELEMEPYSVKYYQDSIIVTGNVDEKKIDNILIFDETGEKEDRIISAKEAFLGEVKEQRGVISLRLQDVFSHTVAPKEKNEFEYLQSERMQYNILLKDISFSIRNPGPSEMSSIDVYNEIQDKEQDLEKERREKQESLAEARFFMSQEYRGIIDRMHADEFVYETAIETLDNQLDRYYKIESKEIKNRSLQLYKLEFYKKFAVPFACFIFILFAFPVGLFTKRSGRSVGFGIGLLIAVLYWGMLFAGQTVGLRMNFPPFLSMWAPNIIIFILGMVFLIIRGRR